MSPASVQTRIGPVHYVRVGAGAPLVLLHGNGQSWREFADVIQPLSKHFDVIAWDMPGHGASPDMLADASAADYAAVLGDLIDALQLEQPALHGSSIGAFVAAAAAAERSDIAAVILEEMQCRKREWWLAAWPVVERMFGSQVQSLEQVQPRFTRSVDDALLARWNETRGRAGAERMIGVMGAIRDFPLTEVLGRIEPPILLLYGDKGPVIETAKDMQALLPRAETRVVQNAGHFISLDQPEAFVETISAFLNGATKRSA